MRISRQQYLELKAAAEVLRRSGVPLTEVQTRTLEKIERTVKDYQAEGERRLRAAFAEAKKEDQQKEGAQSLPYDTET